MKEMNGRTDCMKKFLVVDTGALPDIYEKVLRAKELIRMKEVRGISGAVRTVGISRSTFYKYKDYVFSLSESTLSKKATVHFMLKHKSGVLAKILDIMAKNSANILTINQNIPINNTADVSITFDMTKMEVEVDDMLSEIKKLDGVVNSELIALE